MKATFPYSRSRPSSQEPNSRAGAGLNDVNEERHANWLELFYDLVFIVAITALADRLSRSVSWDGLIGFAMLFVPVWWVWIGKVVYADRFGNEDTVHRLATFGQMAIAAGLAIGINTAFSGDNKVFEVSYVAARSLLLLMYLRARLQVPEARAITTVYLSGFSIGLSCWIISLFMPFPQEHLWRIAGLMIDLATPWAGRKILESSPVNNSHLPERLGLFVIIVLGEAVTRVIHGLAAVNWQFEAVVVALLLFVTAFAVWWLYFNYYEEADFKLTTRAGQSLIYGHWPLIIGLTIFSVGANQAIEQVSDGGVTSGTLVVLCGGAVLWLVSFAVLQLITVNRHSSVFVASVYGPGIVVLVLGAVWGNVLPPLVFFGLLTGVFLALLLLETWLASPQRSA